MADFYTPFMLETLAVAPGLTSPGSLDYYAGEAGLPDDPAEAERVYVTELLPRKIALDLIYVQDRCWQYDVELVIRTLAAMVGIRSAFSAHSCRERAAATELLSAHRTPATAAIRGVGMTPTRVVIIGAARSGTKMLRDALAIATGAGAVPYDIGYVWRIGKRARRRATCSSPISSRNERGDLVTRFIDRYSAGSPPAVIEKTVGNTLRVPFVAAAIPDARFVHLIRDGIDVAESVRRQWTSKTDWRYLAAKARHFPPRFIPGYGRRYAASHPFAGISQGQPGRLLGTKIPGN